MRISDWSSDVCSSDLIVVLAMIAGFVALRLVSVLGRRTGHEQPLPQTLDRSASDGMSRQPGGAETQGPASIVPDSNIDSKAVEGIRAIIAADPSFDVSRFLEGSKSAYRMVLEAFWAGDTATMETLADDSVTRELTAAIDERKAQGLTLDNRVVWIDRAMRSEEQTSELQSLMRSSTNVFCLKKKIYHYKYNDHMI